MRKVHRPRELPGSDVHTAAASMALSTGTASLTAGLPAFPSQGNQALSAAPSFAFDSHPGIEMPSQSVDIQSWADTRPAINHQAQETSLPGQPGWERPCSSASNSKHPAGQPSTMPLHSLDPPLGTAASTLEVPAACCQGGSSAQAEAPGSESAGADAVSVTARKEASSHHASPAQAEAQPALDPETAGANVVSVTAPREASSHHASPAQAEAQPALDPETAGADVVSVTAPREASFQHAGPAQAEAQPALDPESAGADAVLVTARKEASSHHASPAQAEAQPALDPETAGADVVSITAPKEASSHHARPAQAAATAGPSCGPK